MCPVSRAALQSPPPHLVLADVKLRHRAVLWPCLWPVVLPDDARRLLLFNIALFFATVEVLDFEQVDVTALLALLWFMVVQKCADLPIFAFVFKVHFELLQLGNLFAGHELLASCAQALFLDEVRFCVTAIFEAEKL